MTLIDNDTLQRTFQSADNVALALDKEMRIEKVRENIYIYRVQFKFTLVYIIILGVTFLIR